ncbi:MAG: DUF4112 domain-containing protein [Bacteroidota bacterium]
MQDQPTRPFPQLKHLDRASDLLDSRFRIPGTDIRFGVDFLIGLVPYAGDLISFGFSGLLVIAMARHGASGMVILKMLWNVLLDTVVGSIPIIGDLFDLQYKANRRNYILLSEHYGEGEHQGSAWPAVLAVVGALLLLLAGLIWLMFWMVGSLWDVLVEMF